MMTYAKDSTTIAAVDGDCPRRSRTSLVLLSNFLFGAVRGLAYIAATLVTVRLLVRDMGISVFGLLALTTPFFRYGWSGVFDLGLANACMRYTGRAFSENDSEGLNRYINSSLFISSTAAIIVLCGFLLLRHSIAALIVNREPSLLPTALLILTVTVLIYAAYLILNPLFGLLGGIHKLHLTHVLGTLGFLLEVIGILFLHHFGMTVPRVLAVYASICPILLICLVAMAKRGAPYIRFSIRRVDAASVWSLLRFTSQFSLTSIVGTLLPVYDKFVLASFVGVGAAGYYEVAWRIVEWLKRVPQLFLVPALPLAAGRSMDTPGALRTLYTKLLDFTILMSAPLFFIAMSVASPVIRLWTGPGTEAAAFGVCMLAMVHFCNTLTGPASSILAGTNRMKHLMIGTAVTILLCVVLEPILASWAGFVGLLVASFVGLGLFGGLGFLVYVQHYYSALRITRVTFVVLIWTIVAASVPASFAHFGFDKGLFKVSVPSVMVVGLLCLLVYAIAILFYRPNRELLRLGLTEFGRTLSRLVAGSSA